MKHMKLFFLLDPLESLHGPLRPPFLVARELKQYFDVVFVSPIVGKSVAEELRSEGFETRSSGKDYFFSGSLLTLEAWLRRNRFRPRLGSSLVANFSQCFLADADVYYAQGPIAKALDDTSPEMKKTYRLAYTFTRPFFAIRDKSFNKKLRQRSNIFIANSKFCASMYEDWNIKIDDIIYPPLDCETVKPTTSKPSEDYVLTYIGKEAKHSVLKAIADAGIKIKAFGFKAPYIPRYMLKHPNIEFMGKVSDEELLNLYSNALYTFFAFTHEPFGYIPVESMACGTPVLTYNRQGPSESVVDGQTGWLLENTEDLVTVAATLWRESYQQNIRKNCRRRALVFDTKTVAKKWLKLMRSISDGASIP